MTAKNTKAFDERRIVLVPMTEELLCEFLMTGKRQFEVVDGLPEDTQFHGFWVDPEREGLCLGRFSSKKFDKVQVGANCPELKPRILNYKKTTSGGLGKKGFE